jgi:hypothetical protein
LLFISKLLLIPVVALFIFPSPFFHRFPAALYSPSAFGFPAAALLKGKLAEPTLCIPLPGYGSASFPAA